MLPTPIRIVLVDDHPMIRAGLRATINSEPDMTVIAAGANGREGLDLYRQHQPDIMLSDLMMPKMNGVEMIRQIRAEFPAVKTIVLSTFQGDEDIYRAIEAGAITYVLKDMLEETLTCIIREVARGKRPIPPEIAQKLTDRMFQATLTNREVEVLHLVAKGMRNKEIAGELNISDETAQGHVKNILSKLSVHDRTGAVAVAIRRGIVHPD